MQDLIIVKQLPIIEQQLQKISEDIDNKIVKIEKMEVNEETIKEVKKIRTEFKKDFEELEEKRKEVKNKIEEPYNQFKEIYDTYVTNKFTKADKDLKIKIDNIEQRLKDNKEKEVKNYFEEYRQANNIDFVKYEQIGIKVGLSDSLKSLKERVKKFIDQKVDDLNLIETQEHKTEILVEYKQTLNVAASITNVSKRFKAIEEEKTRQEELKKQQEIEKQRVEEITEMTMNTPVEEFIATVVEEAPIQAPVVEEVKIEIPVYTMTFKVTGTLDQLKALKGYIESEGIIYGTI